jgi:GntR family transcriptional regulator
MKLDDSNSAAPMYWQLKEILKEKIRDKSYKVGDKLPTELELKEEFNISRSTVRQAFDQLSKEGYIERKRGRGTIIRKKFIKQIEKVIELKEDISERRQEGIHYRRVEVSAVNIDENIAGKMKLKIGDEVRKVMIKLSFGETPIAYFETYLIKELKFPDEFFGFKEGLYSELKSCNDLTLGMKIETLEVTNKNKEINSILGVNKDEPLVKTTRTGYDSEGRIFEYTINYSVMDKYNLYIETKFC